MTVDTPRRRPGWAALALAAVVALTVAAATAATGVLGGAEQATVAARFRVRDAPRPSDIAVVGIDEATFSELHVQWPFPRSLHARVIDRLHAAGARLIVYDVQFTEPTKPAEDLALYRSIGRAGGAVLATGESDGSGHTDVLGGDANLARIHAEAAASNVISDAGGSITKFPYSVAHLKSLAVVAAERASGAAVRGSRFEHGQAWIDYRGEPGTFPTLSFSAVLRGQFDPSAVRGKIVVVGASAPTLQDVHATPIGDGRLMSGPEVEANAIWTALHGLPLRSGSLGLDLLIVIALVAVPLVARGRLSVGASAGLAGLSAASLLVAAQLAFDSGTIIAVVAPLVGLGVATIGMIVSSYLCESGERRRVSAANEQLARDVRTRTEELADTQLEVVRRLAASVESRDVETGHHVERMSDLCERLALAIGMAPDEAKMLRHAAGLHDIGKIAIPDRVLLKPGSLELDEWELMKSHTTVGADLLAGSRSPFLQLAEVIARTHHERWDGRGYPAGLKGEEIPLSGRICTICDVYDAITSKRPYKPARTSREALSEIARCAGTQFDPRLVEAFLRVVRVEPGDASDPALDAWTPSMLPAGVTQLR